MNTSLNYQQVKLIRIAIESALNKGLDYQDNLALELAAQLFSDAEDLLASGAPVKIHLGIGELLPNAEPIEAGDTVKFESSFGKIGKAVVMGLYDKDNRPVDVLYTGSVGSIQVRRENGSFFLINPTQVIEVVK